VVKKLQEGEVRRRAAIAAVALIVTMPLKAVAQTVPTSWGVIFGISPSWHVPDNSLKSFFDAESTTLEGSELRIGFVRGQTLTGDWGLSLIHKRFKKDSSLVTKPRALDDDDPTFSSDFSGRPAVFTFAPRNTTLLGAEVHRFVVFGTISERVQIGLNLAAGIGQLRGTADRATVFYTGTESRLGSPEAIFDAQPVDAKILFAPWGHQIDWVPLGKIEFAVAGIILPGVKIRGSVGFNMPGIQRFSLEAIYLFGAE
jgi:hypothetical protein